MTPEIAEGLARYLDERDRQHADAVQRALDALTDREQRLVREAAVMGFVRGSMYGRLYPGARMPRDSEMVAEVVDACIAMSDLCPLLSGATPTPTAGESDGTREFYQGMAEQVRRDLLAEFPEAGVPTTTKES